MHDGDKLRECDKDGDVAEGFVRRIEKFETRNKETIGPGRPARVAHKATNEKVKRN